MRMMAKKKPKFKITGEDHIKMDRAARRQVNIEEGKKDYRPTTIHKTSKKDEEDRKDRTVKPSDISWEDYLEEKYSDYNE